MRREFPAQQNEGPSLNWNVCCFSKLRTTSLKLLQPRKCYLQKDIYCKICLPTIPTNQHFFCCGNFGWNILHSMMLRVSSGSTWRGDNQVWLETTRGPARHPRIQGSKSWPKLKSFSHFGEDVWVFLTCWVFGPLFPTCWGKRFFLGGPILSQILARCDWRDGFENQEVLGNVWKCVLPLYMRDNKGVPIPGNKLHKLSPCSNCRTNQISYLGSCLSRFDTSKSVQAGKSKSCLTSKTKRATPEHNVHWNQASCCSGVLRPLRPQLSAVGSSPLKVGWTQMSNKTWTPKVDWWFSMLNAQTRITIKQIQKNMFFRNLNVDWFILRKIPVATCFNTLRTP